MRKFTISLMVLLSFNILVAVAVPAKRGQWKTVTLTDGSQVRVELVGDEFIGCSMTASAVARLNHKVGNDTMEEQRVVITRLDMLEEIVTMKGRFVEELYDDIAFGGLQGDFAPHILCLIGSTRNNKYR